MGLLKVYACYNTDRDVRLNSSSGAVFSSLAEYVLQHKGVVYGVAMAEDCYSAEFIAVTNREDLAKLRGSKYLQAKVGNTYRQVRADLTAGKLVLFSGTGCQINGLKSFLGRDFSNLLCVDVICHGAPSPALWRKYAQHQEQMMGGKLVKINFRCKDDNWTDFGMNEVCKGIPEGELKKLYISKAKDAYMQMFLRDYCLRPSCYECTSKKIRRSDLTIADFWGIDAVAPEMNDGKGTSLAIIRTEKGQAIFEEINSDLRQKEVSYEEGIRENPAEFRSCARPIERDTFFDDMRNLKFEELEKKYAAPRKVGLMNRAKRKIKNMIKTVLRIINNRGGYPPKITDYSLCFIFKCREND